MSYRIAISIGDINGIGPEVVLKTLQDISLSDIAVVILSTPKVVDFYCDLLSVPLDYTKIEKTEDIGESGIFLLESYHNEEVSLHPGEISKQSGRYSMLAVDKGITLCKKNLADALVTAPISKEAINRAGYGYPGHTEFLAEKTGTTDYMMMMVNENLRIGLTTVHIPVADITKNMTTAAILKSIRIMNDTLTGAFTIPEPKIAVLGLNPHAGDGGIIGTEEIDIIAPALQKARFNDIRVSGPFPADGFFGNRKYADYDGILAMYHDQGLIPFKTLSFGAGVNHTAGLPIIRTSPDHGTAFDIAGKNLADPSSFREAFLLAVQLASNKRTEAV